MDPQPAKGNPELNRLSVAPRRPVRLSDIARLANVSTSAVSLALNGRPGVSSRTRQRILDIAADAGWFPNAAARALVGARTGIVGLVLTRDPRDIGTEPFYMSFIAGLEASLSQSATGLLLQFADDERAEVDTYRRWVAERRIDGLILVDLRVNDGRLGVLRDLGACFIVVGDPQYASEAPAIWSDDARAVAGTIRRLTELGHRRFARISERTTMAHTAIRNSAFVTTCAELKLPAPVLREAEPSAVGSRAATAAVLEASTPPTAILYDNNIMAVAGLGVAHQRGLRVPEDISLVAYDDSLLCESTHPSLSAISHDVHRYGEQAGTLLLEVITGQAPQARLDSVPVLIERGSTGPAPRAS
ncbi:LacI family DNA-binding transcriptional regulator [Georgenia halophila]|uniref:LacI family DNA-binding transcriptional regulator n=1 Tax=Georgenia halophila TaxID=620889 RepID=A0ABP8LG73_9MICO